MNHAEAIMRETRVVLAVIHRGHLLVDKDRDQDPDHLIALVKQATNPIISSIITSEGTIVVPVEPRTST